MRKKIVFSVLAVGIFILAYGGYEALYGGRCKPTGNCTACKNCTRCQNCAHNGGSCSVCRK